MPMTANILVLVRIDGGFVAVNLGDQALTQALISSLPSSRQVEQARPTVVGASQTARQAGAQELIAAMESELDANFGRLVEQCLRHLSQYAWLGQSGLAAGLSIEGANQIERGKAVREALSGAIESLRPAGARPGGAQCLPPEWHGYAILHDAYVDDVPNDIIMSRLYISEGTFNRRRREALQAVTRALMEVKRSAMAAAAQTHLPQVGRPLQALPASRSLASWSLSRGGTC